MRYLDHQRDACLPAGYPVVDNERDFLDHALDPDIVVRGPKLCTWAEIFWNGRRLSHQALQSPTKKLRVYSPAITETEARELMGAIPGAELKIQNAANLRELLNALFPADLWRSASSLTHAAHWLLWLEAQSLPPSAEPLIAAQAALWREQVEGNEKSLYTATDRSAARAILDRWLGIEDSSGIDRDLPEFPLPVPDHLLQRSKTRWMRQAIESRGLYFRNVLSRQIPRELKESMAEITAEYYQNHHKGLESSIIQEIADFLPMETVGTLRNIVPPETPPLPPADVLAIVAWFRTVYLPYRLWAIDREDETVKAACRDCGTAFAKWYLEFYPTALAGSDTLGFRRAGKAMHDRRGKVTLMIILDGIGIWDAKELTRQLKSKQKRLVLTKNDWCFAAIPSVTEICKPAMRQGVIPRNVNPNTYGLAPDFVRLLENKDAAERLRTAESGEFYLWSAIQTDQTYHRPGDARTIQDNVRAVLEGFANRIASAVETVPDEQQLQVIITTDHGRFLGRSERTIRVPTGMTSHQRAAWGEDDETRNLRTDYEIIPGGKAARLHPDRYGLAEPALVAIGEESFAHNDGSSGVDYFPHGGAWPEEVIIPWLEFQRDAEPPSVEGRVSGTGVEGREGEIEIHLTNSSQLELEIVSIWMKGGDLNYELPINQKLPPLDTTAIIRRLSPWPAMSKLARMTASGVFRQPVGEQLTIELGLSLTSDSLQTRNESLDDLL